jgi:hypothetical protein
MKKKTLLTLLLCAPTASLWLTVGAAPSPVGCRGAMPVACLWEGEAIGVRSEELSVRPPNSYLLSPISYDISDLDVRDAQNHPIKSPSASQELETLFRENLLNLTVFGNTHSFTQAMSWVESLSYLFHKSILIRLSIVFELFQDVFLPSSRRFVHNVNNLCISFSVGLFAACLMFSACSLQRTPRKVHLRC